MRAIYLNRSTGEFEEKTQKGFAYEKHTVSDEEAEKMLNPEAETKEQDVTGENKSAVGQFWDKLTTPKGRVTQPPAEPVAEDEPEGETEEEVAEDGDEAEDEEVNN